MFWNLLINAAQAIRDGGYISLTAQSAPGADRDEVTVVVADTGEGIAADAMSKIFDPFFTTKSDGTGLGLAIVYRIIADHEGTIDVRSEPGRGTTFTIRLPAPPEGHATGAARRPAAAATERSRP